MADLKIKISNDALALIGQNRIIKAFDNKSLEAAHCERLFDDTLNTLLETFNWSFCRKDEVITEDYLLKEVISLPYNYSYKIPEDVKTILFITHRYDTSDVETLATKETIQFNFRQYDNKKILATNEPPGFVLHYQAHLEDLSIATSGFRQALSYFLASGLAPAFIKGTQGLQVGQELYKQGTLLINTAIGIDSQQGAATIQNGKQSRYIRARR